MAKKKSSTAFRHLGGEVPAELLTDLDRVSENLGLIKKRVVAAALSAFVHAPAQEQLRLYQEVYARYYDKSQAPAAQSLAADLDATLQSAQKSQAARSARKSADQKTA